MAEEVSREAERHERHRKEVLEEAFNHIGKSPSHGKVLLLTKDGADISINMDLLTLFSPFLRSLLSSWSRDSFQVDAIPVLILPPDISAEVVLKINSLLMNGAAKFRNSTVTQLGGFGGGVLFLYFFWLKSVKLEWICNSDVMLCDESKFFYLFEHF